MRRARDPSAPRYPGNLQTSPIASQSLRPVLPPRPRQRLGVYQVAVTPHGVGQLPPSHQLAYPPRAHPKPLGYLPRRQHPLRSRIGGLPGCPAFPVAPPLAVQAPGRPPQLTPRLPAEPNQRLLLPAPRAGLALVRIRFPVRLGRVLLPPAPGFLAATRLALPPHPVHPSPGPVVLGHGLGLPTSGAGLGCLRLNPECHPSLDPDWIRSVNDDTSLKHTITIPGHYNPSQRRRQ